VRSSAGVRRAVQRYRRLPAIGLSETLFVRSHAVNFFRRHLNLLRVHWSAKHGPGIRKAHSPTAARPGQRSQKTLRPRTARYAVSIRRPPTPSAVARRPGPADRQLPQRGRHAPQTREPHRGSGGQGRRQFPHPRDRHTARREAAYRKIGALIDAERLGTNLL
jgi:hypothetical protein